MLWTLKDAKDFVARFVGEGMCSDNAEVTTAINEATMTLLQEGDWKHSLRSICFDTMNNCIALPHDVESIVKVNMCQKPANVFSQFYQYLEGGPGTLDFGNNTYMKDLVDLGDGYPTFFPIAVGTTAKNVIAISDNLNDRNLEIRIKGVLQDKGYGSETIKIALWKDLQEGTIDPDLLEGHYSTKSYLELISLIKPVTQGHVSLIHYNPDTDNVAFYSKYRPKETQPGYRRYRITSTNLEDNSVVVALVKIRYVPLEEDDDVLQIQNLPALRMMIKANREWNDGDVQNAVVLQQNAVRLLDKQLSNHTHGHHEIDFNMGDFMIGSLPNLI